MSNEEEIKAIDAMNVAKKFNRAHSEVFEHLLAKRRKDLTNEVLINYRENKSDREVLRSVGRLAALEELGIELRSEIATGRKAEAKLEELRNEREERAKRDTARRYDGF